MAACQCPSDSLPEDAPSKTAAPSPSLLQPISAPGQQRCSTLAIAAHPMCLPVEDPAADITHRLWGNRGILHQGPAQRSAALRMPESDQSVVRHLRSERSRLPGEGAGIVVTAPAGAPPPPSDGGTYVRPGAYSVPARACCRNDILILRSCSLRRSSSSFRCRAVTPASRHHAGSLATETALRGRQRTNAPRLDGIYARWPAIHVRFDYALTYKAHENMNPSHRNPLCCTPTGAPHEGDDVSPRHQHDT